MERSSASEQDSVTCRLCNEAFEKPSFLLNHLKTTHNIGPQVKNNFICPLCGIRNTEYHSHRDHLLYCHRHKTIGAKHDFKTFSDFLVWKNELESQQETKYVCQNSCNILSKNYKRYYYQCCHSGVFRAGLIGNKFKTRMESTCPSMISVIEYADSNEVKVEFWDTHFGHRGTEEPNENSNVEISTAPSVKEADDSSIDKIYIVQTTGNTNQLTLQNNLDSSNQLLNLQLHPNNTTVFPGNASSPLKTVPFIPNTIFRSFPVSSPDQKVFMGDITIKNYKGIKPKVQSNKKTCKTKFNKNNTKKIGGKSNSTKVATENNNNITIQNGNVNDISKENNNTNLTPGNQIILINTLPNEQAATINSNVCSIAPNNTLLNMVALNGSPGNPVFLNNVVQPVLPVNLVPGLSSQVPMGQVYYTTMPIANQSTSTAINSAACSTETIPTTSSENNAKLSTLANSAEKKQQSSTSPSAPVPSLIAENIKSIPTNSKMDPSSQNFVLSSVAAGPAINNKNVPVGKLPISRINTFRNQTATNQPAGKQMILINSMPFSQMSQSGGNICTMTPTTVIAKNGAPVQQMFVNSPSVNTTCFPATNNLVTAQNSVLPTKVGVSSPSSVGQVYYTKTPLAEQSQPSTKVPEEKSDICIENTFTVSVGKLNLPNTETDSMVSDEDISNELFGMDDNSMGSSSEDDAMSTDNNVTELAAPTDSSDTQSPFSNLVSVACSKNKIAVPSNQLASPKYQRRAKVDSTKNIIFKKDEPAPNNPDTSDTSKVQVSGAVSRTLIGKFSVRSYATTKPKEIKKSDLKSAADVSKCSKTKSSHLLLHKASPSSKFVSSTAASLLAKSTPVLTSQSLGKPSSVTTSTLLNMPPLSSILNSNIVDKSHNRANFSNVVSGTVTSNDIANKILNSDIATVNSNNEVQPLSVTTLPLNLLQNTQNSTIVIPALSNSKTTLIEDSGNLYMLEPIEDGILTSNSNMHTAVMATNLENMSNITRSGSTVEHGRLQYSPVKTQDIDLAKSTKNFNSDTQILQKIEFYKLEMKYLASQEECKRLKIELAKAELKHSHMDDPEHIKNKEQEIKDKKLKAHNQEQVSIQALESSFSSDNDLDIYNLVRSSVLRNIEASLEELSETNKQLTIENKQLSDEVKEYRRNDAFYKLLQTKFSEEDF